MDEILDVQLRQELTSECEDHLLALESELLRLNSGIEGASLDAAHSIFRRLHRVKGGAGYLSNDVLCKLSHTAESVLKLVRDGNILTGKGLGVAFEYAFAIATELGLGKEATEHAAHIYFDNWPIPIAE